KGFGRLEYIKWQFNCHAGVPDTPREAHHHHYHHQSTNQRWWQQLYMT
ncbi:hypothetical protein ACJ73_09849, partial [Blastomyces percursus]